MERAKQFGDLSRRFKIGRAVLVASPNDGTPLATPKRWDETIGWVANLLELFPDNPFTTGGAFVANGIVWLANHVSGDLPGLHSMDGDGDLIAAIQSPPGPPADAYSALVANYQPTGEVLQRLLDVGIDQFFAFGFILKDVVKRPFITMGFTAFVLMIPLALTSTKRWIRRLGRRWQLLHRLIYISAVCASVHYLWKVKVMIGSPVYYAIVIGLLLGFRIVWQLRSAKLLKTQRVTA